MKHYPLLSKPLLSFSFSAFAIGLSEFVVIGLLTQIAASFKLSIPTAGLLITAYALGISGGSPILAHVTRKISSKIICICLISAFTLANLASAIVPSFFAFLAARFFAGAMHGAYFSIASTAAPAIVAPNKAPLAIAVMFSGLTVAMVLGVPAGIEFGVIAGWQSVFIVISLLSGTAGLLIHFFAPLLNDAIDSANEAPLVAHLNSRLLTLYSITVLGFGGGFIFFSYIEPYLRDALSFGPSEIAQSLAVIGLGSLFGNGLGGKLLEILGSMRALICAIVMQSIALSGLALTLHMPLAFHIILFVWSTACFAIAPMVQSSVVTLAAEKKGLNPRLTAAFNATAFNIGISVATFVASRIVTIKGVLDLPFAAALGVLASLPILLLDYRRRFSSNASAQ
mgnify:CR=1 FL=1